MFTSTRHGETSAMKATMKATMKPTMKRRVAALAASVGIAATLIAQPAGVAQAQPAPQDFYSQVQSQYSSLGSSLSLIHI